MFKIGKFYTENDDDGDYDESRKQNDTLKSAFCQKTVLLSYMVDLLYFHR